MFEAKRSCQHNVFHSCNKTGDYFVVAAETCLCQLKIHWPIHCCFLREYPVLQSNIISTHLQVLYKRICTRKMIKKISVNYSCIFIMKCSLGCGPFKWGKVLSSFLVVMTSDDLFSSMGIKGFLQSIKELQ